MSKIYVPHRPHHTFSRIKSHPTASRVLTHPFILAVWILFCVLASWSLISNAIRTRSAFEKKDEAEARLKLEEERGMKLLQQLEEASDPYTKEQIIRDELGLQKPGETILQIPKPSP